MLMQKNVFGFIIYIVYISYEYISECNGYHLVLPSYNNLTRFKRQSTRTDDECNTPEFENGKYEILGYPSYVTGNPIPNYALVKFMCNSQCYALTTPYDTVYCIDGSFQNKLPKCLLSCAPRFSTTIDVKCELDDVKLDCSKRLPEGTIATMKCKPHYMDIMREVSAIICSGGRWNLPSKKCIPECGELVPQAQPLIVRGVAAKRSEFPWHVAIYREETGKPITYICGGSIISVNAVLSAAHCFAKPSNGELYPISEYSVAAGKYYSNWDSPEDADYAQKRKVLKIEIQNNTYLGFRSNFAADIAVIIVDEPFILTNFIKPVCIDWNSEYVNEQLKSNVLGQVVGWGVTSTEDRSVGVDLKKLTIPFIDREQCLEILSPAFRRYITIDKYCTGYANGSSGCIGDSGSGMIFPQHDCKRGKYYIQGVVSINLAKDGTCDDHQIGLYTKVASHLNFIRKIEAQSNRQKDSVDNLDEDPNICGAITTRIQTPVSGNGCTAPVIENGKYEVLGNPLYVTGNQIPNYALVKFMCISQNYALTTPYDKVNCVDGSFNKKLPQCLLSCEPRFSTTIDVKCELDDVELDCSKRLPEGTIATMECKPYYIETSDEVSTIICSGGSWDLPSKKCIPECGELVPEVQTLIVGGVAVKRSEFPWHVAIYREEPGKLITYKCGGSIISVKVVLSAAHCFSKHSNGELYPISEFSLAAGKYYSNWDAPEDADYVQKRKAFKIEIQKDTFLGYTLSFVGDIALVVVNEPFILTNLVKPVCVDWNSKYVDKQLKNNVTGQVVGWGVTSTDGTVASVDLKQLTIPFINRGQCLKIVPQTFKQFLHLDKYCAGFTNGSSVCIGDSGGGMVFPQHELRSTKYYIQGIVSLSPKNNYTCDNYQIGVYTKVASYLKFIRKIEASNRIF